MPLKPFQQNYWNVSSSIVIPVFTPGVGGYPLWQASVIGAGLGGMQPWYERLRARWQWLVALVRLVLRIGRYTSDQRRVIDRTVRAVESPAFAAAQTAVRDTAKTLGFANRESWVPYSRMLKDNPNRAENIFRHVRACELTRGALSSTLTNPEVNLAVELAYCAFAVKGKYFDGAQ